MIEQMVTPKKIKAWYDDFYKSPHIQDPVEEMKQNARIRTIAELAPRDVKTSLFIGCGSGDEMSIVVARELSIGLDWSFYGLKKAKFRRSDCHFVVGDTCNLPFKTDFFDLIVCSEVIEHLPTPKKSVSEMARVLHVMGSAIISCPNLASLFGFSRLLGGFMSRRAMTAADQLIDNWFTTTSLKKLLQSHFVILDMRGYWYFPPTGKGRIKIPASIVYPIFRVLEPIDRFLSIHLPNIGHGIVIKMSSRAKHDVAFESLGLAARGEAER